MGISRGQWAGSLSRGLEGESLSIVIVTFVLSGVDLLGRRSS